MKTLTLTYTFDTEAELLAHLQRAAAPATPLPTIEAPKAPAKKPAAAPQAAPAPSQPTATAATATAAAAPSTAQPAPQPATEPSVDVNSANSSPTYADVSKAVGALLKLTTPDVAVQIAKDLGALTFKALPQEKYAEAIAAVEAKVAELSGGVV